MWISGSVVPNVALGPLRMQWGFGARYFQRASVNGPLVLFGLAIWLVR